MAAQWCWGDELEIEAFVEIDKFCQKVLRKNFPGVPIYDDIKKIQWVVADSERGGRSSAISIARSNGSNLGRSFTTGSEWIKEVGPIDLFTGGFPCQPFSCAGKRAGTEDDRYLWPEMLRTIHEIKPRWVVAENVPGLLTLQDGVVFDGVCVDLENEGYEVLPLIIPACAQGAPHRRDRVWIVGYCKNIGCPGGIETQRWKESDRPQWREVGHEPCGSDCHAPDTASKRCKNGNGMLTGLHRPEMGNRENQNVRDHSGQWKEHWYEAATRLCRVDAGLPRIVDRFNRLKALGNAIVPQIAYQIFKAIKEVENNLAG